MKTAPINPLQIPNRSMEIANIFHRQSFEMMNLVLNHQKSALQEQRQKMTDLMQIKDASNVQQLISANLMGQVTELMSLATKAYQLGFDAQSQVADILKKQIEDSSSLTTSVLSSHALAGNPLSTMAIAVVKHSLDASRSLIDGAKVAAVKTVEFTNDSLSAMKKSRIS
jgi:hypothetical protein